VNAMAKQVQHGQFRAATAKKWPRSRYHLVAFRAGPHSRRDSCAAANRLPDVRAVCARINRLAMDHDAGLIDHHDRKRAVPDPGIMAEPPGKFPAVPDGVARRRKFQPLSVSNWSAVLHLKIESSHHASCGR